MHIFRWPTDIYASFANTRMSSAWFFAAKYLHSWWDLIFSCYSRPYVCAKCTCGYFRKALFDGMPHVVSVFSPALKRNSASRDVHMQWQAGNSHRDSAHLVQRHRNRKGESQAIIVCMGKTIFMGTIKPNCFNLIGNFSSFCWLAFCLFFFGALDR